MKTHPLTSNQSVSQSILLLAMAVGWAALTTCLPPMSCQAMEAGFAERDITPSIGMERPGGYIKNFHRELHDPCKIRAVVFSDQNQRVALVGLDGLMIRGVVVQKARQRITEKCGIPGEAVMIGASHSHSAGPLGMILPGEYDFASPFVQRLAYVESSNADAEYLERVEQAIVDAVCDADAKRVVAKCGIDRGEAKGITFNRRFRMRSGLTQTNPRQGNPETVEPAGPVDPEVGVIGAWNEKKELIGCVVNFACHCTTTPGGISADYVYYIERVIRGVYGEHVIVVFLNGASGDVTQIDNVSPYAIRIREEAARFVGGTVGAEAVKALVRMAPGELVPLAAEQTFLSVARRAPNAAKVKQATEIAQRDRKSEEATRWTFAKETVLADALIKHEPIARFEVQAIQIGPAVFLANPAEYFCQFGLDMKAKSSFPYTFPVSLANDCIGYVPTAEALGPNGGGYETRLTSYSNLIPSAGDQIADACLEMARHFKPGSIPVPPPALPYQGQEWLYGKIPPEVD